jgi:hypothetical protein
MDDDWGDGWAGGSGYDDTYYEEPEGPAHLPPPERCMPSDATWAAMQRLHDDTEASVHELIKCGGLQTSVSRVFVVVVIASNRALFEIDSYTKLVNFAASAGIDLQVPFEPEGEGVWSTPVAALSESRFYMTFHDPTTGDVVLEDPFVMDSYLRGVVGDPWFTIDEMQADLALRNPIEFTWQEPGPLAHLVNLGEPIPNPFHIAVSLGDVFDWSTGFNFFAGDPNFGPLAGILELEVDSHLAFTDQVGSTRIEYDVVGWRKKLREILWTGIDFQVNRLESQSGDLSLTGTATLLHYNQWSGGLEGRFDYRISSPEGDVLVSDTYGAWGVSVNWDCPPDDPVK